MKMMKADKSPDETGGLDQNRALSHKYIDSLLQSTGILRNSKSAHGNRGRMPKPQINKRKSQVMGPVLNFSNQVDNPGPLDISLRMIKTPHNEYSNNFGSSPFNESSFFSKQKVEI